MHNTGMVKAVVKVTPVSVRADSEAQLNRFRRAAKAKRWSLNRFLLEAAEVMTAETLETASHGKPLTVEPNPLTLNQ